MTALLTALLVAGCLEAPEGAEPGTAKGTPNETQASNTTIPEPQIFSGDAIIANPAHTAYCLRNGIDGDHHSLDDDPAGWYFAVEPADAFVVYWFDESHGYLGGGDPKGKVPEEAALAEVCHAKGTLPADYLLELRHPDDPAL